MEDKPILPEQRLWKAVLCQLLYDALSHFENKNTSKYEKQAAENWFKYKTKNFVDVCNYAGFDADYVHKKVNELLSLKKLKKLGIIWNYERKNNYEKNMSTM